MARGPQELVVLRPRSPVQFMPVHAVQSATRLPKALPEF